MCKNIFDSNSILSINLKYFKNFIGTIKVKILLIVSFSGYYLRNTGSYFEIIAICNVLLPAINLKFQ